MSVSANLRASDGALATLVLPDPTVNTPTGGARLGLGMVETQTTVLNATARDALRANPIPLCQSIMGWGVDNPEPSSGSYNFSSLDTRINFMTSTNGPPCITLCAAPDWMKGGAPGTTNWNNIEVAPLPSHYQDFANLAGVIAQRYPQVKYYFVWNELKGMFDDTKNRWNYEGYTQLYNLCYDKLKSIDSTIQVGGPYVAMDTTYNPSPILKGAWGAVDTRSMDVVTYWQANKHGADFVCVDGGPPNGPDEFQCLKYYSDIMAWLKSTTGLPVWWAEWGFELDVGTPVSAQHSLAVYCAAAVELLINGDSAFAWVESLGASSPMAYFNSDGTATPLLLQIQRFDTTFLPGMSRRRINAPATITGLVSSLGSVAINTANSTFNGTIEGVSTSLAPYEIRWT